MTEPNPTYTVPYTKIRECGEPVEPLTPLQSAMAKLSDDSSKSTHLSPRECAAVVAEIKRLQEVIYILEDDLYDCKIQVAIKQTAFDLVIGGTK